MPAPAAPPGTPAIEARGVVKVFPGVVANAGVDLEVRRGEVHALLGENGAGKSSLAAVLAGLYRPDAGQVLIGGEPVTLRSPRDGLARGVGMVHQHFRLVPRFTVAENLALGDRRHPLLLSRGRLEAGVAALGERYGLPVDPRATVADLSVGEQQRVEIVKVLHRGADVLLLDEPTAVLTPQEAEGLFAAVRAMADDGRAVVLISHKLGEVLRAADRVTVLRDGRVAGSAATAGSSVAELARLMVGRDVDLSPLRRDPSLGPLAGPVLELDDVHAGDPSRRSALRGVTLRVRAGEIVGVAGVAGNGQRELADACAGLLTPAAGRVRVRGVDVTGGGPRAARAAGLAYVPEDRLGTGTAPGLSVADNLRLGRPLRFLLDRRGAGREAARVLADFDVRGGGPGAPVRELSGGNVQKVLLARELSEGAGATALVVDAPTRGLDIGSVEFVRGLLDRRRAAGCGVLLVSTDLDEVRALADRIVVLYEGRIVLERDAADADVGELGLAMAGEAVGDPAPAGR